MSASVSSLVGVGGVFRRRAFVDGGEGTGVRSVVVGGALGGFLECSSEAPRVAFGICGRRRFLGRVSCPRFCECPLVCARFGLAAGDCFARGCASGRKCPAHHLGGGRAFLEVSRRRWALALD